MSELFDAVDALVASRSPLPPPAERKRLRQTHALTLDEVAAALNVRRATVSGWESGKTEPRPPQREPYARLLRQLAQLYPAAESTAAPQKDAPTPKTSSGPASTARTRPAAGAVEAAAAPTPGTAPSAVPAAAHAPAAARVQRGPPGRRKDHPARARRRPLRPARPRPAARTRTVRCSSSTPTPTGR